MTRSTPASLRPSSLCVFALCLCASGGPGADLEKLYRDFKHPPRSDSLMPYWFWNGEITAAESKRQMREMIAQGIHQAVVFPWGGMNVQHLSEEYWQQVGAALDAARQLGFTLNFADDYFWPSGHAWQGRSSRPELSLVLQLHPEYRMHRLDFREHTIQGPTNWTGQFDAKPEQVVDARMEANGSILHSSLTNLPASGERIEKRLPDHRKVFL